VILYGWGYGGLATVGNAKPLVALYMLVPRVIPLVWLITVAIPARSLVVDILFSAACSYDCAVIIPRIISRVNCQHPALVQVRLNDKGCVQFDNLAGSPAVHLALPKMLICLGLFFAGSWLVIAGRRGEIHPIGVWLCVAICAILEIVNLWPTVRLLRQLRQLAGGSPIDFYEKFAKRFPWSFIKDFTLQPIDGGNYLLRINTFAETKRNAVVLAEIRCTKEQADALDELLKKWIAGARVPEATRPNILALPQV
jgi:hypothetical protein